MSVRSRSNWNLEVLVFEEKGKPEYPEKTEPHGAKKRTNNKLNPHGVGVGIRTLATLVVGSGVTFNRILDYSRL